MSTTRENGEVLVSCRGLDKWYSGVHALKDVSLDVRRGDVIGLIGDNGAGKSTLIQIMSGVHKPDAGEIWVDGRRVTISSPKLAMRLGIEAIHQYNSMVPTMTIARNVFMGREPLRFQIGGFGLIDRRKMAEDAMAAIRGVELHLRSPDALVGELSGGQRQGVAIARAMHFKSKLLILDEPTNHLSVKETNKVINYVKSLPHQNVTGIFISHNMHHIFDACDRIVVMARGEIVMDCPADQTDIDTIQELL